MDKNWVTMNPDFNPSTQFLTHNPGFDPKPTLKQEKVQVVLKRQLLDNICLFLLRGGLLFDFFSLEKLMATCFAGGEVLGNTISITAASCVVLHQKFR